MTDGLGVDYAFDAIGDARVSRACYDAVRRGGTAVIVGMAPTGTEIPIPATIAGDEKVVKGCFYGSTRPAVDFPRLVDFYQRGALKLDGMITRTYPLDRDQRRIRGARPRRKRARRHHPDARLMQFGVQLHPELGADAVIREAQAGGRTGL